MSHSQLPREYVHPGGELNSAQHWIHTDQGKEVQDSPTSSARNRAAAMHWTNYRSVPGIPANLTHTFPITGPGSGFTSLQPPQDPTPTSQHHSVASKGKPGPARSSKSDARNPDQPRGKDVVPLREEEQHPSPLYIRNQRMDPAIVEANAGTGFLGYHTLAKDRTPEAVFMSPPEPYQVVPEYTTRKTTKPARLPTTGVARRVPRVIEPGELLVMLSDDGPRVVQAVERAPYLVYSVRVRWTIIGSWNERNYAIVDPSSEVAAGGRQWYRFVQPSEMRASEVRPLMQGCLERKGWEFIDARPPGWHIRRRENEVPFLEMMMNTEIDWDLTEWMVGGAGYGE